MSTTLGPGFKLDKATGKIVKRAPRLPAGQMANKHKQAARKAKQWKAKSK
jgi:hypothetical protein